MIIVMLLVATRLIVAFVNPVKPSFIIVKEALFGSAGEPRTFWFPLVPWLAIFLIGSFVGQALSRIKKGILDTSIFMRHMIKSGVALSACCLLLIAGYKVFKMKYANTWDQAVFGALFPNQTALLLPGYCAVLIWIFISVLQRINISGQYHRSLWLLSIFGRTSLFTFVVQFVVVESAPALLGYTGSLDLTGFLLLFIIGLSIMFYLSFSYGRMRGWLRKNDYLACLESVEAGRSL
jgi:hypothetical protein